MEVYAFPYVQCTKCLEVYSGIVSEDRTTITYKHALDASQLNFCENGDFTVPLDKFKTEI